MGFAPRTFQFWSSEITHLNPNPPEWLRYHERKFHSHFATTPLACAAVWNRLESQDLLPRRRWPHPKHLLWTMLFLKTYGSEDVLASQCHTTEKTLRIWVKDFLEAISSLEGLVSSTRLLRAETPTHLPRI
jgi:hypothetical protein